jgi:hypothetical protein
MKVKASAKSRNESEGKPGMRVAASSPPTLTARSRSGKKKAKTTREGRPG